MFSNRLRFDSLKIYNKSKNKFFFKIMPRAQNAHAYVNAAFLIKWNDEMDQILSARACFGGINPKVIF